MDTGFSRTAATNPPRYSRGQVLCLAAGLVLYAVSFFLPAPCGARGWHCATAALRSGLIVVAQPFLIISPFALLLASGLVNPLLLVYLFWWLARPKDERRLKLACVVAVLIQSSWMFLVFATAARRQYAAAADLRPGMEFSGYAAWFVGALLILGTDAYTLIL